MNKKTCKTLASLPILLDYTADRNTIFNRKTQETEAY